MDQNKIVYSFKPIKIVVMIESNFKNWNNIICDCLNVKYMLHVIKHFDMIYHNDKHDLVHLTRRNNNNTNNSNSIVSSKIVQNEFGLNLMMLINFTMKYGKSFKMVNLIMIL